MSENRPWRWQGQLQHHDDALISPDTDMNAFETFAEW